MRKQPKTKQRFKFVIKLPTGKFKSKHDSSYSESLNWEQTVEELRDLNKKITSCFAYVCFEPVYGVSS